MQQTEDKFRHDTELEPYFRVLRKQDELFSSEDLTQLLNKPKVMSASAKISRLLVPVFAIVTAGAFAAVSYFTIPSWWGRTSGSVAATPQQALSQHHLKNHQNLTTAKNTDEKLSESPGPQSVMLNNYPAAQASPAVKALELGQEELAFLGVEPKSYGVWINCGNRKLCFTRQGVLSVPNQETGEYDIPQPLAVSDERGDRWRCVNLPFSALMNEGDIAHYVRSHSSSLMPVLVRSGQLWTHPAPNIESWSTDLLVWYQQRPFYEAFPPQLRSQIERRKRKELTFAYFTGRPETNTYTAGQFSPSRWLRMDDMMLAGFTDTLRHRNKPYDMKKLDAQLRQLDSQMRVINRQLNASQNRYWKKIDSINRKRMTIYQDSFMHAFRNDTTFRRLKDSRKIIIIQDGDTIRLNSRGLKGHYLPGNPDMIYMPEMPQAPVHIPRINIPEVQVPEFHFDMDTIIRVMPENDNNAGGAEEDYYSYSIGKHRLRERHTFHDTKSSGQDHRKIKRKKIKIKVRYYKKSHPDDDAGLRPGQVFVV